MRMEEILMAVYNGKLGHQITRKHDPIPPNECRAIKHPTWRIKEKKF
jgi:hypothetical protein